MFDPLHEDLFAQFGQDGTVSRGAAAPVAVRIVEDRGVQRYGEHGEVVGRVTMVSFLSEQWVPRSGDVVSVNAWTKKVDVLDSDDGFVAKAVMLG